MKHKRTPLLSNCTGWFIQYRDSHKELQYSLSVVLAVVVVVAAAAVVVAVVVVVVVVVVAVAVVVVVVLLLLLLVLVQPNQNNLLLNFEVSSYFAPLPSPPRKKNEVTILHLSKHWEPLFQLTSPTNQVQ